MFYNKHNNSQSGSQAFRQWVPLITEQQS